MAVKMVPNIVAFETVTSGFSTFAAGIVALSIPKKAYNVNAATTGNVAKSFSVSMLIARLGSALVSYSSNYIYHCMERKEFLLAS